MIQSKLFADSFRCEVRFDICGHAVNAPLRGTRGGSGRPVLWDRLSVCPPHPPDNRYWSAARKPQSLADVQSGLLRPVDINNCRRPIVYSFPWGSVHSTFSVCTSIMNTYTDAAANLLQHSLDMRKCADIRWCNDSELQRILLLVTWSCLNRVINTKQFIISMLGLRICRIYKTPSLNTNVFQTQNIKKWIIFNWEKRVRHSQKHSPYDGP